MTEFSGSAHVIKIHKYIPFSENSVSEWAGTINKQFNNLSPFLWVCIPNLIFELTGP